MTDKQWNEKKKKYKTAVVSFAVLYQNFSRETKKEEENSARKSGVPAHILTGNI
jgi:hypothetical protein